MTTLDRPFTAAPSLLKTLTEINLQDMRTSLGLDSFPFGRKALDAVGWIPAQRFARQVIAFDQQVAEEGLRVASKRILGSFVGRLELVGAENIPPAGPLLVLSNHPGMADTIALFSSLPRPDLRVLAAERPFLQALPNVSRHLIFVPDDPHQRMGVVRPAASHLRRGGALLTFPAGEIEPDPACMPGAVDALKNWSESIALFTRLVPEVRVVVAIVSGVIWPAALHSPLTRLRKEQKDRERLGAALQMLANVALPFYQPVTTRIAFSPAFSLAARASNAHAPEQMQIILEQASRLIGQVNVDRPAVAAASLPELGINQVQKQTII